MPTGYTSAIEDGISFRDFVLRCARGMGACIMQRDDPMDQPPKMEVVSDYHKTELEKAEKRLTELKAMSDSDAQTKAEEDYKKEIESLEASIRKNNDLRDKYRSMLSKVEAWNPPTPDHVGFKKFMVDQITESIDFDCNHDYYSEKLKKITPISAHEWRAAQIKKVLWDLDYHKNELSKEIERTADRNNWIARMYESLEEN